MVTIDFFLLLYCDGLTHGNNEIVRWRACGRLRGRGIARNEIEEKTFRTRCADKRNGGREEDESMMLLCRVEGFNGVFSILFGGG